MLLLFFFSVLLIYFYKSKSVTTILFCLQVVSLLIVSLVGKYYQIDTTLKLFNLFFTAIILLIVIHPWNKFRNIKEIYYFDDKKINKFTKFLLLLNLTMFIPLVFIAIYISQFYDRINALKYSGVFMDLLYAQFPIAIKGYILAYYLNPLSYFLIILHFYYLGKQNVRMAIYCFILSLNIILFGLTFFSRWTIINYVLIYAISFYIYKDILSRRVRKIIIKTFITLSILLVFLFVFITINRFDKDVSYENRIPNYSKIKDPTLFSYLDYLSQWYGNSMVVLNNYNFNTFHGQDSFYNLLNLLSQYGLIEHNNYDEYRGILLPDKDSTFNGLVADWVYDFGYTITIIIALLYNYSIMTLKPKNGRISIKKAFLIVLLIQIPLFSIFYDSLRGIIIPLLLFIPIYFYLYSKKKNTKVIAN